MGNDYPKLGRAESIRVFTPARRLMFAAYKSDYRRKHGVDNKDAWTSGCKRVNLFPRAEYSVTIEERPWKRLLAGSRGA